MRNNSGDDEKRNNVQDPTLKEKQGRPKGSIEHGGGQSSTGMGSGNRKSGQEGDRG